MNHLLRRLCCSLMILGAAALPAFAKHDEETTSVVLSDWERLIVLVEARQSIGVVQWISAKNPHMVRLPHVQDSAAAEEAAVSLFLELSAFGAAAGPYASEEVLSRGTTQAIRAVGGIFLDSSGPLLHRLIHPEILQALWEQAHKDLDVTPAVTQSPLPEADPCPHDDLFSFQQAKERLEDLWSLQGSKLTDLTMNSWLAKAKTFLSQVIQTIGKVPELGLKSDASNLADILLACFGESGKLIVWILLKCGLTPEELAALWY